MPQSKGNQSWRDHNQGVFSGLSADVGPLHSEKLVGFSDLCFSLPLSIVHILLEKKKKGIGWTGHHHHHTPVSLKFRRLI